MKFRSLTLTQVDFGNFFVDLIKHVNKNYGFNITEAPATAFARSTNDLTFDESQICWINLYFGSDSGIYEEFQLEINFCEDCRKYGSDRAAINLIKALWKAMDSRQLKELKSSDIADHPLELTSPSGDISYSFLIFEQHPMFYLSEGDLFTYKSMKYKVQFSEQISEDQSFTRIIAVVQTQ